MANWGTCRIHIKEWYWFGSFTSTEPVSIDVYSYINDDQQRSWASVDSNWGQKATWYKASSTLPTDIEIEIAKKKGALKKRDTVDVPPPNSANEALFKSFDLYFTAGSNKWSSGNTDESKLPFCRVGAWDEAWQTIDHIPSNIRPVSVLQSIHQHKLTLPVEPTDGLLLELWINVGGKAHPHCSSRRQSGSHPPYNYTQDRRMADVLRLFVTISR
jgi:hypothetical protein